MSNTRTTICLVRHGEVHNPDQIIYGRAVDVPLSEAGSKQMKALAERLQDRGVKPDAIYTSPLRRSYQSAVAMTAVFAGVPVFEEEDLQDSDHTALQNKTIDWLESIGGDVYSIPELMDSIERPEAIAQRILEVLDKVRKKHEGKTILVVSHGDPIAFARCRILQPVGELPSIAELAKKDYLRKAEAWRVVFDEAGRVIDYEWISRDVGTIKEEREY